MQTFVVQMVGDSLGVTFSQNDADRFGIVAGAPFYAVGTGKMLMLVRDGEYARQLEVAETVMRENRDVLRRLAE